MQELGAGFVAAAFAAGEFGFGFDEPAGDGGFEDGGFVALEVGLDALEVGDGFVEAGELFFDFRDDAFLLVEGWNGYWKIEGLPYLNERLSRSTLYPEFLIIHEIPQKFVLYLVCLRKENVGVCDG